MKKTAVLLSIALCLVLGSCKKSSPVPEMVDLMNKTTEKIENAKTPDEVNKINTEFAKQLEELKDDYPDYEPTDEEKTQIVEASIKMATASSKSFLQNIPESMSGTVDGVEQAAQEVAETAGQE